DLAEFVEADVGQFAPLDAMNYDFPAEEVGSGRHILAVAANKDDVEPRIAMFETAGLPLSALDLDLLAQRNAFVYWMNTHAPEMADEKVAVFGIYATQMYALILQNGRILYKPETPVSTEQLNRVSHGDYTHLKMPTK
ncbi:pilus assembly protein PilM, partial [Neisseria sp. P0022.S002]|uniref:pilus assembly protein PilM n=1 Tax=Neisseria sp. P0022.S002 TaxID=3436827 RepID=UPI003F7E93AD